MIFLLNTNTLLETLTHPESMRDIKDLPVVRSTEQVKKELKKKKKSGSTRLGICTIRKNAVGFVESAWTTWAKGISIQ